VTSSVIRGSVIRSSVIRGVGLMLLLAGVAVATTLKRLSLDEVAHGSREIVVGTVQKTVAVAGDDERNLIFTDVEFGQLAIWKGSVSDSTVTYRFTGGTIGRRTLTVVGVPRFEVGKRYVLFANPDADEICPTVGWMQGRYVVRKDTKSTTERVYDSDGHAVYGFVAGAPLLKPTKDRPRALTLVEFQVEVLRAIEVARVRQERDEKPAEDDRGTDAKRDQPPAPERTEKVR